MRGEGANRVGFFQPTANNKLSHVFHMCPAQRKGKGCAVAAWIR